MAQHRPAWGQGLFGKDSAASYDVYLNLTPLMDVMSNILFFLLAAFGASAVAMIAVSVPVDSPTAVQDSTPDDHVMVTLRADAGGLTLGCEASGHPPEDLDLCRRRIPKKGQVYDVEALNVALVTIKSKFAGSDTVMLVPDDDLKFTGIVRLLDAARQVNGSVNRLPLYPNVVLSHMAEP